MSEFLSFGAWVQRRRRALDLTQAELARRVGCAEVTIHKIEAEERRPSRQVAALLATHLQLPPAMHASFVRTARGELAADHLPAPAVLELAGMPPERPATSPRGQLPTPPNPLIGRTAECADLCAWLVRPDVRLLTLTGVGGVGKTRLALAAAATLADHFADGVWWVDLAPLRTASEVAPAMVRALGLTELPGQAPVAILTNWLRHREVLLLLDNAEQVVDAGPLLAELLSAAPGLRLLVTSRAPLHLRAEQVAPVAPLAVPPLPKAGGTEPWRHGDAEESVVPDADSPGLPVSRSPGQAAHPDLTQYDAVRLFVERARAGQPAFVLTADNAAAVAAICRRLDGLPLAIELAAARVRLFPPPALLTQLEQHGLLATLVGGARDLPDRQQTLAATLEWSYRLLTPAAQLLLARLGVFTGSFDLAALASVCGDAEERVLGSEWSIEPSANADVLLEPLEELVDHGLVTPGAVRDGTLRFGLLETVRAYAIERLVEAGEPTILRDRHLAHYVALAEAAEPQLRSGAQLAWLARLDAEDANLHAAIDWAHGAEPDERAPEADPVVIARRTLGLRLASALWYYWYLRGRFGEALRTLDSAWARDERLPAAVRCRALLGAWFDTWSWTGLTADRELRQAAIALARQIGDDWALALVLGRGERGSDPADIEEAFTLAQRLDDHWLYATVMCQAAVWNEEEQRESCFDATEQLARAVGDQALLAQVLDWKGLVQRAQGKLDLARHAHEEMLALTRAYDYRYLTSSALAGLARVLEELGDLDQARAFQAERLLIERELGNVPGIAVVLLHSAELAIEQGAFSEAGLLLEELQSQHLDHYISQFGRWTPTIGLTWLAIERGAYAEAARMASEMYQAAPDALYHIISSYRLGGALAAQGDLAAAEAAYTNMIQHCKEVGPPLSFWLLSAPGSFGGMTRSLGGLARVALWRYGPDTGLVWLDQQYTLISRCSGISVRALARGSRERLLIAAGRYTEAIAGLAEALRFFRHAHARPRLAETLELAAALRADQGRLILASRLWRIAKSIRQQIGVPMWPCDRPDYERRVAAARATLGDRVLAI